MEGIKPGAIATIVKVSCFLLILASVFLFGCPQYRVYSATKTGEAELRQAESNRQIKILEAEAIYKSAENLSRADTIRAHGVARANAIIGNSLKDNEAYLKWLWIDNLEKNPNAVIYVPTENNMPLMKSLK